MKAMSAVTTHRQATLGQLQNLSCPLLEKLRDSLEYVRAAVELQDIPTSDCKLLMKGIQLPGHDAIPATNGRCFVTYEAQSGTLVLCFKNVCKVAAAATPEQLSEALAALLKGPLVAPSWLAQAAPGAHVLECMLDVFDSLRCEGLDMAAAIDHLTGGATVRSVKVTGWCVAGMVATIAAVWAALQFPAADVRCITFGAQKVGNAAFAQAFRWLVGLSYRVVYLRDPVPSNKGKTGLFTDAMQHVHGEIYIDNARVQPGAQPSDHTFNKNDHIWAKYLEAVEDGVASAQQKDADLTATIAQQDPTLKACLAQMDAHSLTSNDSRPSSLKDYCSSGELGPERLASGEAPLVISSDTVDAPSGIESAVIDPALKRKFAASVNAQHTQSAASPAADHEAHVAVQATAQGDLQASELLSDRAVGDRSETSAKHAASNPPASLQQVLLTGKISQAAVLSAAAYEDEATFRRITGIEKCRLIVDKKDRNTHVHVAWLDDGTAIFAFRGTATLQDGMADLKVLRLDVHYLTELFPGTLAHLGFLQQFVGVCKPHQPQNDLAAVVKELSGGLEPTRIICCGHSLGGALATLGAAWAALQWCKADVRCITFGSPRVGNRPFKQAFHSLVGTSFRCVHGRDPVPTLPPSMLYHHVNGAIHIQPSGQIWLRSRSWHYKYWPSVAHHSMVKYNTGIYTHFPGVLHALPALADVAGKSVAEACKLMHKDGHHQADESSPASEVYQGMLPAQRTATCAPGMLLGSCLPIRTGAGQTDDEHVKADAAIESAKL